MTPSYTQPYAASFVSLPFALSSRVPRASIKKATDTRLPLYSLSDTDDITVLQFLGLEEEAGVKTKQLLRDIWNTLLIMFDHSAAIPLCHGECPRLPGTW